MSILYIISTPIGNLEDISLRALRVLREEVETIFCEDTRVSIKLLNHYEIEGKKLISCNKESEARKLKLLIEKLDAGENLALMSDAGTPLISDPGSLIVEALSETEHELVTLPGASSLTAALSLCPFNTARFVFEGFLPHGPKQRRRVLRDLADEKRAMLFFESPHRILKTLEDMKNILGDRKVFLARELTKKFEQHYCGDIEEIVEELTQQFSSDVVGEFVLITSPVNH